MATGMFMSTDGLPGPVIVNRLGKPATWRPSIVRGPSAQASASADAAGAADVHAQQRTGHGVEAGREDDGVELVLAPPSCAGRSG